MPYIRCKRWVSALDNAMTTANDGSTENTRPETDGQNKKVRDRGQNSAPVIVWRLMLYTRLASPVAVCIAIRGRYTRLAWLANPKPNPNLVTLHTASRVYRHSLVTSQFRQIVMIQLNCITNALCNCFSTISRWNWPLYVNSNRANIFIGVCLLWVSVTLDLDS